jgi:hypothetical protein
MKDCQRESVLPSVMWSTYNLRRNFDPGVKRLASMTFHDLRKSLLSLP